MQTNESMIAEYLANIAALEARKAVLVAARAREASPQLRYNLTGRIITLRSMIGDSRHAVWLMQQYWEAGNG